jgi:hypothetical protein
MAAFADPLEAAIFEGAIRALRKRAFALRDRAKEGVVRHEKGCLVVTSEARADLDFADDLEAVANELILAEGGA